MFRTFRSEWYEKKLNKLSNQEQKRVSNFEQSLKQNPFQGRPLGYDFFREKKFNGKRLYFLVYDSHEVVFLITISDKKTQQQVIDIIKSNLDVYNAELNKILGNL